MPTVADQQVVCVCNQNRLTKCFVHPEVYAVRRAEHELRHALDFCAEYDPSMLLGLFDEYATAIATERAVLVGRIHDLERKLEKTK